jgi:hypothetical protein
MSNPESVRRKRELLIRLNSLPIDFVLNGDERTCRHWSNLLLYDSEGGEGWRVLLRKTYWEIFTYDEAFWELIASDTGSGGFSEPREAPIVAIAVIPISHIRLEDKRLIYVSPDGSGEQELHASRYIQFSELLKEGEHIAEHPGDLVKRAVQKILPEGITFEFQPVTATSVGVDTFM